MRRRDHGSTSQRERLDGEGGGHVLGPTRVDLPGGDEHEPHPRSGVEELDCAVVVGEGGAIGVLDGDVLSEGEADGVVRDGEGGELDGVDGDLGLFGFEDGEVNDADDDEEEDEENCGHNAGGQIGPARRRTRWFVSHLSSLSFCLTIFRWWFVSFCAVARDVKKEKMLLTTFSFCNMFV